MISSDSSNGEPTLQHLHEALSQREKTFFSPLATLSAAAVRRHREASLERGYRQAFSLDADRIMHSMAYARYIDKTQVFSLIKNDHITHRVLHVQLVSKISRTIGRFLGLNEDLIEAIALGHDIGHTPFGHDGERHLSSLCRQSGIGPFLHNVQSIQFLDRVERKGQGWNLSLQVLDGILCHDGEIHNQKVKPNRNKSFKTLDKELYLKSDDPNMELTPMTMEGCIVRMADTVAYIGRDLEDAIRLGIIRRDEIPKEIVAVLGDTNGTIVYRLVTDIICNSYKNPFVSFSAKISKALADLKRFNLERIYMNPDIKKNSPKIKELFEVLFERCLDDLTSGNHASPIFRGFLQNMSANYVDGHDKAEIVRDFIAGMTDRFFLDQCRSLGLPQISQLGLDS
jgi:dGTPase